VNWPKAGKSQIVFDEWITTQNLTEILRLPSRTCLANDRPLKCSSQSESPPPAPLRAVIVSASTSKRAPSWTIDAPLKAVAPTLDGRIRPDEYGPVYDARFDDAGNPGRLYTHTPARSKALEDHRYRLRAAHTARALYLAFQVSDQDVQVDPRTADRPHLNDCIELFIDADHISNDLGPFAGNLSRAGFQVDADAEGHQSTAASDLTNSDWKVATRRVAGGYTMEFEIPLGALDVKDGPGTIPAKTGDTLRFNVGGSDVDA
jgi:hypothetical protein